MSNIRYEPFWHLGSYRYPYYRGELRTLFDSYVKNSYLVLDAGCGDKGGYILKMSIYAQGVGVDIDRKNVEKSVKWSKDLQLHNLSFLVGDLEKLPFRKNLFDIIICCDVLEHLKDSQKAIEQFGFSLKRGGRLLISTSNMFNPSMFADIILPRRVSETIIRRFGGPHYHKRTFRFSPWNLAEKLNKYGLTVENLLMFGFPPLNRPWRYQYSAIRLPKIYYFWIVFNKLTNGWVLKTFKENMLVVAKMRAQLNGAVGDFNANLPVNSFLVGFF